jgi:hypothetical protein
VDTIKTLARDRHFFTAEIYLADYGQVVLIGDQKAVKRLLEVIKEHAEHELTAVEETTPNPTRTPGSNPAQAARMGRLNSATKRVSAVTPGPTRGSGP